MFIESLCPDSINTVSKSFGPAFDKGLLDMADVEFVTYGKMAETYNEKTNLYEYTCQNGPTECWGNKFQACLMNDLKIDPRKFLNIMVCIYSFVDWKNHDFSHALMTCATAESFDLFIEAKKCGDDYSKWQPLIHQNAEKTPGYPQEIAYVPFVYVDGEHPEQDEEMAIIHDVFRWACKNYRGTYKPETCHLRSKDPLFVVKINMGSLKIIKDISFYI